MILAQRLLQCMSKNTLLGRFPVFVIISGRFMCTGMLNDFMMFFIIARCAHTPVDTEHGEYNEGSCFESPTPDSFSCNLFSVQTISLTVSLRFHEIFAKLCHQYYV